MGGLSMEPLILASSSPRRKELLESMGIPFETFSPEVDESCSLPPASAVCEISRRKALFTQHIYPGRWIVAADTLVSLCDRKLGKPTNKDEARRMLLDLSGREHEVWTGVTVISPLGLIRTEADKSTVRFRTITAEELENYIASGEPMDKAGAYAIQGKASEWVVSVNGSKDTVIGLHCERVRLLLNEMGFCRE